MSRLDRFFLLTKPTTLSSKSEDYLYGVCMEKWPPLTVTAKSWSGIGPKCANFWYVGPISMGKVCVKFWPNKFGKKSELETCRKSVKAPEMAKMRVFGMSLTLIFYKSCWAQILHTPSPLIWDQHIKNWHILVRFQVNLWLLPSGGVDRPYKLHTKNPQTLGLAWEASSVK